MILEEALPGDLKYKNSLKFCSWYILSVTSHINCIVACCLITLSLSRRVPLSGHVDVALFEWGRWLRWINTKKIENNVKIASFKSETMGKLIKMNTRFLSFDIRFTRLASRTHVESLGKPRDIKKRSQSLAVKRHSTSILNILGISLYKPVQDPALLIWQLSHCRASTQTARALTACMAPVWK